jgi:flagellar export protein FliJ
MKPFHFQLERVLQWRRRQAEIEDFKLAQTLAQAQRLQTEREALAESRRQAQLGVIRASATTAEDLWTLRDYLVQADRQDRVLAERISKQARVVESQRLRTVEAQRRREALERLRQSRHDEWRRETNRELEAFASEAFLARWGSQRGSSADSGPPHA